MKRIAILVLVFFLFALFVGCDNLSGRPFVTEWQWKSGQKVTVPIYGNNVKGFVHAQNHSDVNLKIEISEGKVCTFTASYDDTYEMTIYPEGVTQFQVFDYDRPYEGLTDEEADKKYKELGDFCATLFKIKQWGDVKWRSMVWAFALCQNMTLASDAGNPNLENCRSCKAMFFECKRFNTPLNEWNVSHIEDMGAMFSECSSFNQPLDKWDVSHVKDMRFMFDRCPRFNQPLASWDVSQCQNMSCMFRECISFSQPLNSWNVFNVTDMSEMFRGAKSFNQPLGLWDLSNVESLARIFEKAENFNQDLSSWRIPKCKSISFAHSGMSSDNLSKTLIEWKNNFGWVKGLIVDIEGLTVNDEANNILQMCNESGTWKVYR